MPINYLLISYRCIKNANLTLMCAVVLTVLTTGCGSDDFTDLQQYIASVKTRPSGTVTPLPDVKIIEAFTFKPNDLRDPFKQLVHSEQVAGMSITTGNGLKPDFNRRKEELEAFPLDGLIMVGTVVKKETTWGLVKASDGTVHRLRVGNYMGKNYGKIIHISSDKIELMEIVPDKPGSWREQQASIALTE